MIKYIADKVDKAVCMITVLRIGKMLEHQEGVLLDMEPEEAVKWIDDKIKEGQAMIDDPTCEPELREGIEMIMHKWKMVRGKKMWQIGQR